MLSAQRLAAGLSALACLAAGLAGCGGTPKGAVSGKVSYRDRAVTEGQVSFLSAKGVPIMAAIRPDGTYTAEGLAYGDYLVAVISIAKGTDPMTAARRLREKAAKNPGQGNGAADAALDRALREGPRYLVPARYADHATSRLTFKVDRVRDTFNLDLK
ncbi:MAG: hypothetical protein IT429_24060 [Gemmataceae bacterium]|nr:hypothetical protein [Gemmataceae bacterium]